MFSTKNIEVCGVSGETRSRPFKFKHGSTFSMILQGAYIANPNHGMSAEDRGLLWHDRTVWLGVIVPKNMSLGSGWQR